jgi:hypothetical protein
LICTALVVIVVIIIVVIVFTAFVVKDPAAFLMFALTEFKQLL